MVSTVRWVQSGAPPQLDEIMLEGCAERMHLWRQAADAVGALAGRPGRMSRTEADLRVYAHDAIAPHHDKDFRYLTVLPMNCLRSIHLKVWLVDIRGQVQ